MSDEGNGGRPQGETSPPAAGPPSAPGYPPGPQYAPPAPPHGAPSVPRKRTGLLIGVVIAVVLVCGLAACAAAVVGFGWFVTNVEETGAPARKGGPTVIEVDNKKAAREDALAKMAEARKLADARKYDAAYDLYFSIAEGAPDDTQTASQALEAVASAFDQQMGASRLSKQLDQAAVLYKRFPPGRRPKVMDDIVQRLLIDPVGEEASEGKLYLDDRRQFVKSIEDKGKGQVYMTPKKDRLLTEAEVVGAQAHFAELEVQASIVDLYEYVRPMAAAMDRFFADDSRYLGEKTVTNRDLHELGASCDALEKTLGPVQTRLDKVKPGWR